MVEREIRHCLDRGDPAGAATVAIRGHGAAILTTELSSGGTLRILDAASGSRQRQPPGHCARRRRPRADAQRSLARRRHHHHGATDFRCRTST